MAKCMFPVYSLPLTEEEREEIIGVMVPVESEIKAGELQNGLFSLLLRSYATPGRRDENTQGLGELDRGLLAIRTAIDKSLEDFARMTGLPKEELYAEPHTGQGINLFNIKFSPMVEKILSGVYEPKVDLSGYSDSTLVKWANNFYATRMVK